jgi:ribonucleoside-triphosphate reductase
VNCAPPKHFDSALNQIANFFGVVTNEWAGAQAVNSLDIFLAPFVRYDGLSYKDVKQKLQGFIYTLNLPTRWGGQCVSEDTEALTSNGWKKYYEINKDKDKIATFNLKTKKIEYLKPERVMAYDYDGYLICLKNRTQEQLVTPNHKVVRKKFNSDEFELIEAEKLLQFKTPVLVPIAAEVSNRKKINPWLVRLLAWLVSEGTFSEDRERVSLYQSEKNKENCKEIRECLNKLKFSWDETKRIHGWGKTPLVRFRLNQESSRKIRQLINSKKIPNFIKELIPEQIKLFIDTYIKGDGYIGKFKKRISTKDIMVRNQLQELCPLAGYGTTNRLRKHNNVWEINVLKNKLAIITKIFYVRYKGKVWCPTTENGTFVARRNGKVFITGNTPFTNITFDLKVPDDLASKPVIIGGKFQKEKYKDFQKEVDMINRAFAEIMLEGNSQGRVFTFPIPTYNVTRDFDWNSPIVDLIFEMTAKYGIPYFQNFVRSKLDPHEIRAMCCHLRLDLTQLKYRRVGGFFGFADQTGSVGVVTINMPRIGYLAKNEKDFFKRLGKLMDIARDSLEIKRKVVAENMKRGLLPFSQKYLGTLRAHFSTIGLVGMHEACLNFLGKGIETDEGKQFAIKVLNFMRDKLVEYQKQTGNIYNLEATPAESTAHRFARIDKEKWPKIKTAGVKVPYYTNSTHLPVGYTDDVFKALKHQNDLQVLYTGGTIFHAYLDERPTAKACKAFVKKIFENFDLPYITITPTFSICPDHGYIPGEHFKCPKCGKVAEVYSRVVGFLRPVQNWNVGKQEEFRERLEYKIEA